MRKADIKTLLYYIEFTYLSSVSSASKIFLSNSFLYPVDFVLIPFSITHCSFLSILLYEYKNVYYHFYFNLSKLIFTGNTSEFVYLSHFTLSALSRAFTLSIVARKRFSSFGNSHRRSALSRTSCLCT